MPAPSGDDGGIASNLDVSAVPDRGTGVALLKRARTAVSATWTKGTSNLKRLLLIHQDAATAQRMALRCLEKGVAVVIAENVCEAVRTLATTPVALIVVDLDRLRLGIRDQAALFDHVAPGVPVIVAVRPTLPLEKRAALDLAGFRVLPSPLEPDDVLKAFD
jgi:CheY-like chemotaxis protein